MSDTLNNITEDLAAAAAAAATTQATSAPAPVPGPPPLTGGSPVDAAAITATVSMETLLTACDTIEAAAAIKQTAALVESPPLIAAQDEQAAGAMTEAASTLPQVVTI